MKRRFTLITKILLGFVIFAVLICASSALVGYFQERNYLQKEYNSQAYQVADVVSDYFDDDEKELYLEGARKAKEGTLTEEEYRRITEDEDFIWYQDQMKTLREDMNVNGIYMAYIDVDELYGYSGSTKDWNPLSYVFCYYANEEYTFSFGEPGEMPTQFIDEYIAICETGEVQDSLFIYSDDFGRSTTALLPVNLSGETLGIIGVEISMNIINEATMDYILRLLGTVALVTVICVIGFALFVYFGMIKPLNLISTEIEDFVQSDNRISRKLSQVKTGDEIQEISESLLRMEVDINRYIENLTNVTSEREKLEAELNIATQIQTDMLPGTFPAFPDRRDFDIYASMKTAREVGGDFYDFFLVDEDHLALVLADVSGKGVPAALFMVIAMTLIRNEARSGKSPEAVAESVNNELCANNEAQMFVTAWMGILELSTGRLKAVNAGHEYPVIKRRDGHFSTLEDEHGFVMAAMENIDYTEYELHLERGDTLLIYTDGAPDAVNEREEQFGRDRILDVLNRDPDADPEELLERLGGDIESFTGEAEQFDDISMLCITYLGK